MLIMELRKQLCVDCSCPPVVSVLYTTKIEPKKIFPVRLCFGACEAICRMIVVHAQVKVRGFFRFRKEDNHGKGLWKNSQQRATRQLGKSA